VLRLLLLMMSHASPTLRLLVSGVVVVAVAMVPPRQHPSMQ